MKYKRWHDKVVPWTLVARRGEGAPSVTYGTYPTKRKAVDAMLANRKPKTPIVRVEHTFTFQLAD